jgi:hypothetical protein
LVAGSAITNRLFRDQESYGAPNHGAPVVLADRRVRFGPRKPRHPAAGLAGPPQKPGMPAAGPRGRFGPGAAIPGHLHQAPLRFFTNFEGGAP